MSLLESIRTDLNSNSQLGFLQESKQVGSSIKSACCTESYFEIFHFYVAPKNGLYKSAEMQEFMMKGVLSSVPVGDHEDFSEDDRYLRMGKLVFSENIGKCIKTIEIADPSLKHLEGSSETSIDRLILVMPYSDIALACAAYEGNLPRIADNSLEKRRFLKPYMVENISSRKIEKPGFFKSIFSRS